MHELLDRVEAVRNEMKTLIQMAEATKRLTARLDKAQVLALLQAGYEGLEGELNALLLEVSRQVTDAGQTTSATGEGSDSDD